MKKIMIIAIFLLLNTFVKAQSLELYSIEGNVKEVPDKTVVDLIEYKGRTGETVAIDTIMNGRFRFSDTLCNKSYTMVIHLRDQKKFSGSIRLWVDNNPIKISGTGKYLSSWEVNSDNKNQIINTEFDIETRKLKVMSDSIMLLGHNARYKESANVYFKKVIPLWKIINGIDFKLIQKKPNNLIAIEKLYYIAKYDSIISQDQVRAVYDKLDTKYKNTFYGKGVLECLEKS